LLENCRCAVAEMLPPSCGIVIVDMKKNVHLPTSDRITSTIIMVYINYGTTYTFFPTFFNPTRAWEDYKLPGSSEF
jgi:hypothetical protein